MITDEKRIVDELSATRRKYLQLAEQKYREGNIKRFQTSLAKASGIEQACLAIDVELTGTGTIDLILKIRAEEGKDE